MPLFMKCFQHHPLWDSLSFICRGDATLLRLLVWTLHKEAVAGENRTRGWRIYTRMATLWLTEWSEVSVLGRPSAFRLCVRLSHDDRQTHWLTVIIVCMNGSYSSPYDCIRFFSIFQVQALKNKTAAAPFLSVSSSFFLQSQFVA